MTVGAIDQADWTTGPQEAFSSLGPSNNSTWASSRIKPDIMGPDGVSTSGYSTFYGTSASSPHVAGAGALLLSEDPGRTASDLQTKLETDAIDMGTAGKDNVYGSGRLNLTPPDTAAVFRVTKEGNVYADQAYYGANFLSGSADIAEAVSVTEPVEPGDVIELDPTHPGHYRKSSKPYSTLASGVISTQPAFRLGISKSDWENHTNGLTSFINAPLRFENISATTLSISSKLNKPYEPHELNEPIVDLGHWTMDIGLSSISNQYLVPDTWYLTTDFEPLFSTLTLPGFEELLFHQFITQKLSDKPLLALMGVVPVKATAENGPIQPGDLLTTSTKPGYVMACKDRAKCAGAIVGKALEPLTEGDGKIKMLVMR